MKNLTYSILIIVVVLLSAFSTIRDNNEEQDSISPFVGNWNYSTESYEMNIEVYSTLGGYKSFCSIIAMNGDRMDIGSKENPNVEILDFNQGTGLLNIKISSAYSQAKYHATLKKISPSQIEFILGDRIANGIHFYPRKSTKLDKQ